MKKKNKLTAVLAPAACLPLILNLAANCISVNAAEYEKVYFYDAENYYAGDVNHDDLVNAADLVIFSKFIINRDTEDQYELRRADMDHNGILNSLDTAILRRNILGDVEPEQIVSPGTTENELPIEAPIKPVDHATPSTGDVKMLAFYVDFADTKYSDEMYSTEQLNDELFGNGAAQYPYESLTAWFERSSYGNLHLSGNVYTYSCSGNMSDYQDDTGFERLVMEVTSGLDDEIDFSDYDSDNDGIIDCMTFTVPLDDADEETKNFWWGSTSTWYQNPYYEIDNMRIENYIIMDVMPYQNNMGEMKLTTIHEMGHSMGLPDYYKYESEDWQAFHGDAGYTKMDDCIGDFTSFDKIMFGWLTESEIQKFSGNTQTFELSDAAQTGSCLLLPISSDADDYLSEYFLIEYVSDECNNTDIYSWNDRSGVRIFHVQSEIYTDYWDRTFFKYENYSEHYMGDDKIRVLQLVNDDGGFYHSGDSVSFGTKNFAAYDQNGDQTIDTGYTIDIGDIIDGKYAITVKRTND